GRHSDDVIAAVDLRCTVVDRAGDQAVIRVDVQAARHTAGRESERVAVWVAGTDLQTDLVSFGVGLAAGVGNVREFYVPEVMLRDRQDQALPAVRGVAGGSGVEPGALGGG